MVDIRRLHAETFIKAMSTGRTRPSLFSCDRGDGQCEEYVVKFHGQLRSRIVCEYLAAALGRYLQLPIPRAAIVDIDPRLVDAIPDGGVRELLTNAGGPHFGSQHVTGGFTLPPIGGSPLLTTSMSQALDLFAWDMLIQNPDRSGRVDGGNPNLLLRGNQFLAIDHEFAFSFVDLLGPPPSAWKFRGSGWVESHYFYQPLRQYASKHKISFESFLDRFATVSDTFLDQVTEMIPSEWDYTARVEKIRLHLVLVRDNIDRFSRGLLEVFV